MFAKTLNIQDMRHLKTIKEASEYLRSMLGRANHHAGNVVGVAYTLFGIVLERADDIYVFERNGETKNVVWIYVNGKRYAFTYDHETMRIYLRYNSTRGDLLAVFSNDTRYDDIIKAFDTM